MSARYKKLFHLRHRLYTSHAPLLIESGALLLEQESGTLLCQLSFRNIQERTVKALRAVIQMLDTDGRPMGRPVDHRYQDLDLKREDICGRDIAIVLPSSQAASFSARVTQVTFDDGELWSSAAPWEALPDQDSLEDHFDRTEELQRFLRRFGQNCSYAPLETEELWFCTCGAVNPNTDGRCHRCHRKRSALLGKGPDSPVPEDPEEEEYRDQARLSEKIPLRLRGIAIGAAALVLLGILALVLIPRPGKAEPTETPPPAAEATEDPVSAEQRAAYEKALALQRDAEADQAEVRFDLYLSAAEAFEALGAYEDSADRAARCREQLVLLNEAVLQADYAAAQELLSQQRYSEARAAFLALGDYKDSADLANEAVYQKAQGLYRYIEANSVRGFTAFLSSAPEEESVVAIPRDQLLRLGLAGLEELKLLFGTDPVIFTAADEGADLPPLQEALVTLLEPLGDYKDSGDMALRLPEMIDQSDAFFDLCESGDLEAARNWLEAWDKPFEDKELWLQRLDRFLPINGVWQFSNGDPSLITYMDGGYGKLYTVRCRVSLSREGAVLCFLLSEDAESGPELHAGLDEDCFRLDTDTVSYLAQLNPSGSLSLNKAEGGFITGGAEFIRG